MKKQQEKTKIIHSILANKEKINLNYNFGLNYNKKKEILKGSKKGIMKMENVITIIINNSKKHKTYTTHTHTEREREREREREFPYFCFAFCTRNYSRESKGEFPPTAEFF